MKKPIAKEEIENAVILRIMQFLEDEKAIDELKKLYDIRRSKQRDMILKALENSAHSLDEILTFINSPKNDEEEADA